MKSKRARLFNLLIIPVLIFVASCTDIENTDPCAGFCPAGFECQNDICVPISSEAVVVSGQITTATTWTSDKIWELAGKVVVEGTTLTIEPGTIIKGRTGSGTLASALIIARGAKIEACGTVDNPIIFTSVLDDIKTGEKSGTNLTETDNEKWGGLIILGNAPVSTKDGDTQGQIEGIPANEAYGVYGGDDDADNSGSLCYVSVRHGGALIGEGNEINGITLGGVGNGTTINHVEVVANLDDGIELFGGTVNLSSVLVAFQGDDGIDIDQNWSGTINNFYVIHGGDGTDEGLEIDGPEGSTNTDGKFTLMNGTVISSDGKGSCADLKSKAQGNIRNVSFIGYSSYIKLSAKFDPDNNCADKTDAYTHFKDGDLQLNNCELVSSSASLADFVNVYTKTEECLSSLSNTLQNNVDDTVSATGNSVVTLSTTGAETDEFKTWSWSSMHGQIR